MRKFRIQIIQKFHENKCESFTKNNAKILRKNDPAISRKKWKSCKNDKNFTKKNIILKNKCKVFRKSCENALKKTKF